MNCKLHKTGSSFIEMKKTGLAEKSVDEVYTIFPTGFLIHDDEDPFKIYSSMGVESLTSFLVVLPVPELYKSLSIRVELTCLGQLSGLLMTPLTISGISSHLMPSRIRLSVFATKSINISVSDRYFKFLVY